MEWPRYPGFLGVEMGIEMCHPTCFQQLAECGNIFNEQRIENLWSSTAWLSEARKSWHLTWLDVSLSQIEETFHFSVHKKMLGNGSLDRLRGKWCLKQHRSQCEISSHALILWLLHCGRANSSKNFQLASRWTIKTRVSSCRAKLLGSDFISGHPLYMTLFPGLEVLSGHSDFLFLLSLLSPPLSTVWNPT